MKEKPQIENANSHIEFRLKSQESEPQQGVALESTGLIQQRDSLLNFLLSKFICPKLLKSIAIKLY
jgi:hypothetical protein